jgi:CheY-like chemotaxis protein
MINDVLDLSRLEMVGFTLSRERTDLEPLVRDAADIVEDLFRNRPISLELNIEPHLPMLEVDRLRIRQVLLNLLNNAARFTQAGMVLVRAQHLDGEVTVSVSDTGPGIPADKMAHLFEEFYQVDHSLHRQHSGMGLGLAISKHFVEAHEGRIWVESEEGIGSTFTFALPVPGAHTPVSGLSLGRAPDTSAAAMHRPIIVVDRDPMVSELVSRHLEGREVLQVDDVQQLEQQVLLHHPQAIILNVPPRDSETHGETLAASVPLIECSLPSQTWVARDLSVVGCLVKPITAERLLHEVDQIGHVRRLLVVDDDLPFCQLVERMLEACKRDMRVRRAYSGTDALLALRTEPPDLMLLDLALPGMDGFQVLEQMRLDPQISDVPVLLVTATNLAEEAMKRQGAQVLIRRPDGLGPAETLRCLRTVLNILEPRYDESTVPDLMSS